MYRDHKVLLYKTHSPDSYDNQWLYYYYLYNVYYLYNILIHFLLKQLYYSMNELLRLGVPSTEKCSLNSAFFTFFRLKFLMECLIKTRNDSLVISYIDVVPLKFVVCFVSRLAKLPC